MALLPWSGHRMVSGLSKSLSLIETRPWNESLSLIDTDNMNELDPLIDTKQMSESLKQNETLGENEPSQPTGMDTCPKSVPLKTGTQLTCKHGRFWRSCLRCKNLLREEPPPGNLRANDRLRANDNNHK
jgi:hypothetical protein